MIKTHHIKIYPNKTMRKVLVKSSDYNRYCWNKGLALWNDMYESFLLDDENKELKPTERKVRDSLVHDKEDWEHSRSSRVLQMAIKDLKKAFENMWNPNMPNHKHPKFTSKKFSKMIFSSDRISVKDGLLWLDKPKTIPRNDWYGIRMAEQPRFNGKIKKGAVIRRADGWYVSLNIEVEEETLSLPKKQSIAGVDANIRHFDYNDGQWVVNLPKLIKHYQRISYYQRLLARKRTTNPENFRTVRYDKVRTKLQREYKKVLNIQMDSMNKFTHMLVTNYGEIHIEDLDVNGMKMSKKIGKNLHRAMFGKFKDILTYKAEWYDRDLVLVDRFYPSTQRCSDCGHIKTKDSYGGKHTLLGDSIYRQHQTYRCYECGLVIDRDRNAVENLIQYQA